MVEALRKEVVSLKPEPVPLLKMNWLAVNGFVPKIPENANMSTSPEYIEYVRVGERA